MVAKQSQKELFLYSFVCIFYIIYKQIEKSKEERANAFFDFVLLRNPINTEKIYHL